MRARLVAVVALFIVYASAQSTPAPTEAATTTPSPTAAPSATPPTSTPAPTAASTTTPAPSPSVDAGASTPAPVQRVSTGGLQCVDPNEVVLEFCNASYVNYKYMFNSNDTTGASGNDSFARDVFHNFERALDIYNCEEFQRYWTCDDCKAAYKKWLCAVLFKNCTEFVEVEVVDPEDPAKKEKDLVDPCLNVPSSNPEHCTYKPCQDTCYEVVRKCPVHLKFKCPPVQDTRDYRPDNCSLIGDRLIPAASPNSPAGRPLPSAWAAAAAAVSLVVVGMWC